MTNKDFDSAPIKSKSSNKIINRIPQPLTVVEGQTSDGTIYVIPDTPEAYGDEKSVVQMTEDYVGEKTGSNKEAKLAAETAGEQYNTDIRARIAAIRQQQFFSKYPAGYEFVHRDNEGTVTGVTLLFAFWNPETQKTEYTEKFMDAGSLIGQAIMSGRLDLLEKMT